MPSPIAASSSAVQKPLAAQASAPPALQAPSPAAQAPETPVQMVIHLVPLGKIPPEMVQQASEGLSQHAPVRVIVEQARELPESTRSTRPGAYRAEKLLDWLDKQPFVPQGKVMGITEVDIVTRKGQILNWGILGLGAIDGRACVLSTYRMRRRWEGGGTPEQVVRERLWKIAIHELGHTLGLEHCPTEGCIMEDGHGTVKTVDRDKALCPLCQKRFEESLERQAQLLKDSSR